MDFDNIITHIQLTNDETGLLLVSWDGEVVIIDFDSTDIISLIDSTGLEFKYVLISPQENYMVTIDKSEIATLWSLDPDAEEQLLYNFEGVYDYDETQFEFTLDESYVLSGVNDDLQAFMIDLEALEVQYQWNNIFDIDISPNNT